MQWVEHEQTQVVGTSWAAMALMYGQYPHAEPIERAVRMVMGRQLPVSPVLPSVLHMLTVFSLGRFLGSRSHRRYLQQDLCDHLPVVQVLVYDLDAGKGT
jgi:hypothetical protein